jgi:hypothetical protein
MTMMPSGSSPALRAGHSARPARTGLTAGVAGAVTLAAALALTLSGCSQPAGARPVSAALAGRVAGTQLTPPVPGQVAKSTELATVRAAAPRYASPGRLATGTVPASWYQRPSVLPVIAVKPGWVEVRLAQRPNESTAWLPASDVRLSTTPYEIVIDLATTTLSLFDHGRRVLSAPAGVGTTDDPTPLGQYFVAFVEPPPQPNAGYGPFVIVTSAHSPAISDWEGSGDAVIGIHGPLGADSEIGTAGAKISHGCIRLHDNALERLAKVHPGTPIDIVH